MSTHTQQVAVLAGSLFQAVLHFVLEALIAHATQALHTLGHWQAHHAFDVDLGLRGWGRLHIRFR
jgi:hypothetical protein